MHARPGLLRCAVLARGRLRPERFRFAARFDAHARNRDLVVQEAREPCVRERILRRRGDRVAEFAHAVLVALVGAAARRVRPEVHRESSVAVHLWNECIRTFKDAPAPAGSFLHRLQQEGAD